MAIPERKTPARVAMLTAKSSTPVVRPADPVLLVIETGGGLLLTRAAEARGGPDQAARGLHGGDFSPLTTLQTLIGDTRCDPVQRDLVQYTHIIRVDSRSA